MRDAIVDWESRRLVEGVPTSEGMFVDFHVDALASKLYAFYAETKALLCGSIAFQFDLAACPYYSLPGESVKRSAA